MKKSRIILSIVTIIFLIICIAIVIILKFNNNNIFNNKNLNINNYNTNFTNTNSDYNNNHNIINIDNFNNTTNDSNKIRHQNTINTVNNKSSETETDKKYFEDITMSNVNSDNLYKATNNLLKDLYENINNLDTNQINLIVKNNISNNFDKNDQDIIGNQAYRIYENRNTPNSIPFNGLSRQFCELISINEIESNYEYCTYKATVKYIFTQMPIALGDNQYSYEKVVTECIKLNSDGKISSIVDIQ